MMRSSLVGAGLALSIVLPLCRAGPVIFWASNPAPQNSSVQVTGSGLAGVVVRVCSSTTCTLVPSTSWDGGLSLSLPEDMPTALFNVSVCPGDGGPDCAFISLNAPTVAWVHGGGGGNASVEQGGTLRLFGTSLAFDGSGLCLPITADSSLTAYSVWEGLAAELRLAYAETLAAPLRSSDWHALAEATHATAGATRAGHRVHLGSPTVTLQSTYDGSLHTLPVGLASCYRVEAGVGPATPTGLYNVWVNNGLDAPGPGRVVTTVSVLPPAVTPPSVFPVGGPCPDIPSCLAMAAAAGGGTVSIPPGTYDMPANTVLNLSGRVQLVGAGQNSTVLVWGSNSHPAPPGLLLCTGGGGGRMADFAAHVTSAVQSAVLFQSSSGCTAERLSVNVVFPSTNASDAIRPAFLALDSSAWRLLSSSFTHIGNCSSSWPYNTAYYVGRCADYLFANNTFLCGCQGHSTDSSVRGVYDGVTVVTLSNDAEGDGFSSFSTYVLEDIYFGRGLDMDNPSATKRWETMTFDGPGSAFFGRLSSLSSPDGDTQSLTTLDAPFNHNPGADVVGGLVFVMQGPGVGQVSRVVSSAGNGTEWVISPPFAGPVTTGLGGSLLTICPYRGGFTFEGNAYINGTTWQLFGTAVDITAGGNYEQSVGAGMMAWGRMYQGGWQPNARVLFEHNTLRCSGGLRATSDDEATPLPPVPFLGPYNSGLAFRRNTLLAGSGVSLAGATWDVVTDQNIFAPSPCRAGGAVLPAGTTVVANTTQHVLVRA